MNSITTAISSAIAQQTATTGEISRSIQQASHATSNVSATLAELTTAATQTGTAGTEVVSPARGLSHQSEALHQEVEGLLARIRAP